MWWVSVREKVEEKRRFAVMNYEHVYSQKKQSKKTLHISAYIISKRLEHWDYICQKLENLFAAFFVADTVSLAAVGLT